MSTTSPPRSIAVARQSWPLFQSLISDQAIAPFLLKALRSIQQHPSDCGRPFRLPGKAEGLLRTDVVALPGDKQLWLFWNPAMAPVEVSLTLR